MSFAPETTHRVNAVTKMTDKKSSSFKVTLLHDMKMTIRRKDLLLQNNLETVAEYSDLNDAETKSVRTAMFVTGQKHETESQQEVDVDLTTVKCKPERTWEGQVHGESSLPATCLFSCSHQERQNTLSHSHNIRTACDIKSNKVIVKSESLSSEEYNSHTSVPVLRAEPGVALKTYISQIKTEPIWEFDSEVHLNCESDYHGPVYMENAKISIKSILPADTPCSSLPDMGSGQSECGHYRQNRMLAKSEPVFDREDEVSVRDDFVVEMDMAMEDGECDGLQKLGEESYTSQQCGSGSEQCSPVEKEVELPVNFSKRNKRQSKIMEKEEFVCGICNVEFTSNLQCIEHLQTLHATDTLYACAECQLIFSQHSELLEHEKNHVVDGGKHYKHCCEDCGMRFTSLTSLRFHTRLHTENKAYRCGDCDKVFTHIYMLTLHKKQHKVKKDHVCEECGSAFHRPLYLKHHMRIHTGERPFVCGQCGKTFSYSSNLTAHLRTHTGHKPYKCAVCLATFTTSSALTVHKWCHIDTRPFQCEHCGHHFTTANTYKRHLAKHTGQKDHKCQKCSKAFTQPSSLTIHMRSHTGERPFHCTVCGATFVQSAHLTVHTRTHTGERPYACHLCPKVYQRSEYLLRHKRRVHGPSSITTKVKCCDLKKQS